VAILGPLNTRHYFGGVATFVEELAKALSKQGNDVHLVTNDYPYQRYEDIPVYAPAKEPGWLGGLSIAAVHRIKRFLATNQFDLVITNLYYSLFLGSVSASTRTAHILHGWRGFYPGLKEIMRALLVSYENILGAKRADMTIANSYLTKSLYKAMFGINAKVVPLGVSVPDSINISKMRRKEVLYVGGVERYKQVDLLIDAFKLVSLTGDEMLRIVGSGPCLEELKQKVRRLNLQGRILFEGRVDRENVYEFYAKAHCFVSLRSAEPFGLTYLEALACGCPVVLLQGSGFSPFLRKEWGIVVTQEDAEHVARAMERCFNAKWSREQIAEEVRRDFSWDKAAKDIMDFTFID
jgi:glycosyltransferase involved in cell wall biosynthesis